MKFLIISYKDDAAEYSRCGDGRRYSSRFEMKRVDNEEDAIDHIFHLEMGVRDEAGRYDVGSIEKEI
jgi:hypothetical protein